MNDQLNNIIQKQKAERDFILSQPKVNREKTSVLKEMLKSSLIKVITGPRRAGKSTLAFQVLANENFGYFNFEEDLLPEHIDTDILIDSLIRIYDNPKYLFLDEIQHLEKWEQLANKLHRRGVNLILTGSNSKLLTGDLASSLTGRFVNLEVLPFSFHEFVDFKGTDRSTLEKYYETYESTSGYPDLLIKNENPGLYINTLFDSIVLRDIVKRYKLRNVNLVSSLYNRLSHSICSKMSYRQLEKDLEGAVSVNTIKKYLGYANDAYLYLELQPFVFKPKLRLKSDRKLYAIDHGYINFKSILLLEAHSDSMENIVFIELMRRGFQVNHSLFYYRTKQGHEVDFLTRSTNGEIDLIQVTYSLESAKTRERELRSLVDAKNELVVKSCTVITRNESRVENIKGKRIEVVRIRDWLMGVGNK